MLYLVYCVELRTNVKFSSIIIFLLFSVSDTSPAIDDAQAEHMSLERPGTNIHDSEIKLPSNEFLKREYIDRKFNTKNTFIIM